MENNICISCGAPAEEHDLMCGSCQEEIWKDDQPARGAGLMDDITFEKIHKAFLEAYTLEECTYRPGQKEYLKLKATVEKIMGEGKGCERCDTCPNVENCKRDFPGGG